MSLVLVDGTIVVVPLLVAVHVMVVFDVVELPLTITGLWPSGQ